MTKTGLFANAAAMGLLTAVCVVPGGAWAQEAAQTTGQRTDLSEVVVTAEKREERVQDVPAPVSVVNTTTLAENNQGRLQDFFIYVPDFSVQPGGLGMTNLSIRGISPYGGVATVGAVIDDIPFEIVSGSLANTIPDLDPSDLSRIEVLRGPQGTLYGADSLAGLVRYVTRDPSVDGYSGRIEAGLDSVYNGPTPGYSLRGSVNVPISDTLAVRASAFSRQDPGYISNPVLHTDGINEAQTYGGRIVALWKPSETFSVKLTALYQDSKYNGAPDIDVPNSAYPQTLGLHGLEQNYLPGLGGGSTSIQLYTATIKARLGIFELTSLTGYLYQKSPETYDLTYAGLVPSPTFPTAVGLPAYYLDKTSKITQEFRAQTSIGNRADITVGAFLGNEFGSDVNFGFYPVDASNTPLGTLLAFSQQNNSFDEYAVFGDATIHLTPKMSLELGGRESYFSLIGTPLTVTGEDALAFYGADPSIQPEARFTRNVFTYNIAPKYNITQDVMVYARIATGFRVGTANVPLPGVPSSSAPDSTINYEIGTKAELFDHKLSIDGSVFYIDWTDIQVNLNAPVTNFGYVGNAGAAKSEGVELSIVAKPLPGLSISGWAAYDDAELTKGFPSNSANYGASGDPLPQSPRYSGTLAFEQDFPIWGGTGYVGAVGSYVGDSKGPFTATAARLDFPAYAKLDLRAGFRYKQWNIAAYINNVTNKLAIFNVGTAPFSEIPITPRLMGFTVARNF